MAGYRARGRVPEGQAAGAGAVLLREHGPSHHQGRQEREFSWLPQSLTPGPDPEQGWGSGFCSPLGTCKVSRLGRWEDPRELQLSRKECSLNERHGGRGELPAKKGD